MLFITVQAIIFGIKWMGPPGGSIYSSRDNFVMFELTISKAMPLCTRTELRYLSDQEREKDKTPARPNFTTKRPSLRSLNINNARTTVSQFLRHSYLGLPYFPGVPHFPRIVYPGLLCEFIMRSDN